MRTEKELEIDVVKQLCAEVGGYSEVARAMGRTRQYVSQMFNPNTGNKFKLSFFMDAFEKMNIEEKIDIDISRKMDMLTKYEILKTKGA